MGKLEDLEASSASLTANVTELRGKVTGLISASDATTAALVDLRNQQGLSVDAVARIDAIIAAQTVAVNDLNLSDAEVDAAAARSAAAAAGGVVVPGIGTGT